MMRNSLESLVIPFTGERFTPETTGDIKLEHLHRYIFAQELALNKIVLDIACGEGYGSFLIANVATHVVGVDISEDTVNHARLKYCKDNLEFKIGDCSVIPLPDHSVDLIISFETIEHHDKHEAMMLDIKRVLKPGGTIIISSPDKYEYSDIANYRNEFHVKELYRQEFEKLIKSYFKHVVFLGQRVIYGSGLFLENVSGQFISYSAADIYEGRNHACSGLWRPVYNIAVASDTDIGILTSSFLDQEVSASTIVQSYLAQNDNLNKVILERNKHILNLNQVLTEKDFLSKNLEQHAVNLEAIVVTKTSEINELKQHVANLDKVITANISEINNLKQHAANLDQVIIDNKFHLADLQKSLQISNENLKFAEKEAEKNQQRIEEFLSSTSWRITEPLRWLARFFKKDQENITYISNNNDSKSEIDFLLPENFNFDAEFYQKTYPDTQGLDPYWHYVNYGRNEGRLPCPSLMPVASEEIKKFDPSKENALIVIDDFDAEFYQKSYPDAHGLDPYWHYVNYGKNEGRLPCAPPLLVKDEKFLGLDPSKENILIVTHEASRTGAPILSLNIAQHFKAKNYNVVILLLKGGDLLAEFQDQFDIVIEASPSYSPIAVTLLLEQLLCRVNLKFAIVNSIASRSALPALAKNFVPSLLLIHEFASEYPKNTILEVMSWASQIIFSARIVCESYNFQNNFLKRYLPIIIPQGKCKVPSSSEQSYDKVGKEINKIFLSNTNSDDTVIILGAGSIAFRKGVDIFLACAARVVRLHPNNPFKFIWVGRFDPSLEASYNAFLKDQITRAGLEGYVCFTGELSDIDAVYKLSDVLFLSSRLDPLPNVAIDAIFNNIPIICFDKTTGIVDFLNENGLGDECVLPYLDIEQAAQRLITLIDNTEYRKQLGKKLKKAGEKLFNMDSYINSLEQTALKCIDMQESLKNDCNIIEEAKIIDLPYYLPPCISAYPKSDNAAYTYKEAVQDFVFSWRGGRIGLRKPFPGFHPGIYEDFHSLARSAKNPLAAFIQAGKPKGPWLSDLILPSVNVGKKYHLKLKTALHIHAFFIDLFDDIYQRIYEQKLPVDLLISVPSHEIFKKVQHITTNYTNGIVDIRIVPNRGRDIGPLITEFGRIILKNYEIIGHVHTKKTSHVHDAIGKIWFNFLLENLIGNKYPMAAIILEKLTLNEKIGLVFPDDPNILGWTDNKKIAKKFASEELAINDLPDEHFNFPVGTMFWARTDAIKYILRKEFKWNYYPEEPLPIDGTVLHAIERLLPLIAQNAGYQVTMTHISEITR